MQGAALPQASLIKGRFGGIVYMVEDSNGEAVEPIPNKKSADQRSSNKSLSYRLNLRPI